MATKYWVGTNDDWSDDANWSLSSGGAGGAGAPTASDDVIFDGGGVQRCILDADPTIASLTLASGYTGAGGDGSFNCGGHRDFTINGDLTAANDSFTLNTSTVHVAGDVDLSAVGSFVGASTGGPPTVRLFGSADQIFSPFPAGDVDVVFEVDKTAGTVTLTGPLVKKAFIGTGCDGFDPSGQTIDLVADCTWSAAFELSADADAFNGCSWTIGGNFTADGQTVNATASWDLSVTGSATANGTGAVAYSDASGGTEIDASGGPWTDNGNNSNWNFVSASTVHARRSMQQLLIPAAST